MSETDRNTVYDKLTPQRKRLVDAVIRNLESGTGLWKQGWRIMSAPISAITGKKYNGVNRLFLTAAIMERGYSDNRWLTYNQMKEKGWDFKRDEEGNSLGKKAGVSIEYFELRDSKTKQPFDKRVLDGMTEDERKEYTDENVYALRKYYCVFNGDVIDGIPERDKGEVDPNGKNSRAENLLRYWDENEAKIIYGKDEAYYSPKTDEIHLPERKSFESLPEFYSTALHEIGHSTGHETRLNRDLGGGRNTPEYAIEELRAEFASMFMVQDFGIETSESRVENNSAYIQAWHDKIKEDPNILFKAIADAERISKFVTEKEKQASAEKAAMLEAVEEEKSEIYLPPSEVAARETEKVSAAEMTGRGIESLTRMDDRDVIDKASKTKSGDRFLALFNGESVLKTEEQNERFLMARLAMFTGENAEQLLRIFRASGQFRESKPISYYEKIVKEEMQFVLGLMKPTPTDVAAKSTDGRFVNTKS